MRTRKFVPFTFLALGISTPAALAQFQTAVDYSTPQRPSYAALGDLDGDGDMDAAVTTSTQDKVTFLANAGNGTFAAAGIFLLPPASSAQGIVAEDLDADGDLDLAVALDNQNSVMVLFNNGAFSFSPGGTTAAGTEPRSMDSGDIDNDGDVDVVVANRGGNSVTVLTNNGAGVLSSAGTHAVGADVRDVALAELNGDNLLDIVASCHDSATLDVLFNSGGASFGAPTSLLIGGFGFGLRPEGLDTGDFDGDLDMDIAVATSNNGLFFASVFTNNGGTFAGNVNFPTGGVDPSDVFAADFDGNGSIDLAVANTDSNNVSFLPNTGGAFGAPTLFAVGTAPDRMDGADLDGNGSPDLMVVNPDSDDVSVLLNEGAQFASFCFGDGGDQMGCTSCPCSNDAPIGSTGGCLNSAVTSCELLASGGGSVSAANLRFEASGVVPSAFGVLTSGTSQAPANPTNPCFTQNPGSGILSVNLDGLRCVVQGVLRHGARMSDANGAIGTTTPGWGAPDGFFAFNQFVAGQTRHFQIIYREVAGAVCMTAQNTSQGVTVSFAP